MYAQQYKIKAQLIYECELHYNDYENEKNYDFPRYFILRRPKDSMRGENMEWQGFVKDIKNNIEKNHLN